MSEGRGIGRREFLAAAGGGLAATVLGSCMTPPMEHSAIAYNNENYIHAVYWLDKHIEENPRDAKAYYARGRSYFSLAQGMNVNHIEKAIEDYTLAIELDPKPMLLVVRGVAHHARGQLRRDLWPIKKARADFEKAKEIDENHTDAYIGLGIALTTLKKYEKAYDAIKHAKDLIKKGHKLEQFHADRIHVLEKQLRQLLGLPPVDEV